MASPAKARHWKGVVVKWYFKLVKLHSCSCVHLSFLCLFLSTSRAGESTSSYNIRKYHTSVWLYGFSNSCTALIFPGSVAIPSWKMWHRKHFSGEKYLHAIAQRHWEAWSSVKRWNTPPIQSSNLSNVEPKDNAILVNLAGFWLKAGKYRLHYMLKRTISWSIAESEIHCTFNWHIPILVS